MRPILVTSLCPFCRAAIGRLSSAWRCPGCKTLHHRECVREHGRCTVHGCGHRYEKPLGSEAATLVAEVRRELGRVGPALRRATRAMRRVGVTAFLFFGSGRLAPSRERALMRWVRSRRARGPGSGPPSTRRTPPS